MEKRYSIPPQGHAGIVSEPPFRELGTALRSLAMPGNEYSRHAPAGYPALDAPELPQYKLQVTLTQPARIIQNREGL